VYNCNVQFSQRVSYADAVS